MSSTITLPEAVTEMEQRARANLARLAGAHHLPVQPDGIRWSSGPGWAALRVQVPARADVDLWATVLGVEAVDDDIICDSVIEPGAWVVDRERIARLADWLPDVMLRIRWNEVRRAPAPKESTR